jgi:hypothetical protein
MQIGFQRRVDLLAPEAYIGATKSGSGFSGMSGKDIL